MQIQTQFLTHRRAVADQIVERMAADAGFREAMTAQPEVALQAAGIELGESDAWDAEVSRAQPCPYSCWNTTCTSMFSV